MFLQTGFIFLGLNERQSVDTEQIKLDITVRDSGIGTIELSTKLGHGTEFRVSITLKKLH